MIDQYSSFAKTKFARRWSRRLFCVLALTAFSGAQDQADLTQLSPEQLSKIEVTSVSKKQQKVSDTAAAVYVITQQDIRNSPATSIPELLRMVPGLDVAQISGGAWAISARGFAEQYANKMLVLVDGRSVFHPAFSGVVWSELDGLLEDIERIEIIRGPGATVWGPNAVNGVINIITKAAQETPGVQVSAGAGTVERSAGSARYGGKLGKSTSYRIYSKYFDDGPSGDVLGQRGIDSWRSTQGGFRIDSEVSDRDTLILEGDMFTSKNGVISSAFSYSDPFFSSFVDSENNGGENFLARWTRKSLNGSETALQASFSHSAEDSSVLDINGNVMSVSVQHTMLVGERHSIVTGLQYDYSAIRSVSLSGLSWDPINPSVQRASGFIQDEMLFARGAVRFTTGLRIGHSSLSGGEFEPTARVLWKINPVHSVWLAYSLAHAGVSLVDTSLRSNIAAFSGPGGTEVLRFYGNPGGKAEMVNAFDVGYRLQPNKAVSFDLAAFYNLYAGLRGLEQGQPLFESGPPPRLVIPLVLQNNVSGSSFGGEFVAHWVPMKWLHVSAAYSFIEIDMTQPATAFGETATEMSRQTPRHKLAVDTSFSLTRTLRLGAALSFVDRRVDQNLPGYSLVDTKLSWRARPAFDISIGAMNLFNKEHMEFFSEQGGIPTTLGRRVFGEVAWHSSR
jgi:iron complex outermembrane receptor protein